MDKLITLQHIYIYTHIRTSPICRGPSSSLSNCLILYMHFCSRLISAHSPVGGEEMPKQNHQKIQGQSRETLIYLCFVWCCCCSPSALSCRGNPPKQNTHPNKSVARLVSEVFVQIVPSFPLKMSRKQSERVCMNCANFFFGLGGFSDGLPSLNFEPGETEHCRRPQDDLFRSSLQASN